MNWWRRQIHKFSRQELRTYERNHHVIEEMKQCPKLKEVLFEMREDCMRRVFYLEGVKKMQEEGKIIMLNKILDLDKSCKRGIDMFKQISSERSSDIENELMNYQDESES